MPSITEPTLNLSEAGTLGSIGVRIAYKANFSTAERQAAEAGQGFVEDISIQGVDVFGADEHLFAFPPQEIDVPAEAEPIVVPRERFETVLRETLNEDPFGESEIIGRIVICQQGTANEVSANTPQINLSL